MGNHLLRCISTTLLILMAVASNAQVFQTNNQPYKFRGLKAADLLIAPKGCDTTALSNPKWGESTAGALFVDTCNNRLYFFNGLKWNQVTGGGGGVDSFYYNFRNLNDTTLLWDRGDGTVDTLAFSSGGTSLIGSYVDSVTTVGDTLFYWKGGNSTFVTNIATAAAGGDTTIFEIVLDSTGQPNRRVLFSETGNKIGSDNTFLWDKVNNKLVINGTNVSIGGPTAKLVVVGRAVFGVVNTDALQVQALTEVTDTSTYKPMVVDAVGIAYKMNRWPSGSDTTGLGSLYIRNQFATQEAKAFNIRSGRLDSLYAGGSGGVHFATNTGASAFEYGGGGGTQVTFNGFAGYNANRAASYTARSFTDKNYVDSSIAAGGGGGITIDSVAVRRIPQGTFNHYVGFNSGVGGTGTSGGNVTTDNGQAGENLVLFKDAGFSFRTSGRFDGQNLLIGTSSGKWITNSAFNVGIGFQTLGGANASIADSLWTTTSAGYHIAIGFQALSKIKSNDAQNSQVAIGRGAMQNYTSCSGCTNSQVAIGTLALNASTTSQKNTAVGSNALSSVTTNGDNTAVGFNSLGSNTGQSNTAVGSQALLSNTNQQGSTAVGFNAGVSSTGGFNSFFGWASGGNLSVSGSNNTSVGAGNIVGTSGSNNVSIGASVGVPSNTASNQFALGASSVRWLISDVSGSSRRWTFNGTTSDITATEASAALEVRSTSGGLLVPRMTATQASAIGTPANGNILYVTDTNATFTSVGFWGRENGAWVKL